MKILKHGVIYRFICAACGCEFVEGEKNVRNFGFSHFKAACPMCGCLAEGEKELLVDFGEKHENDDSEQDLR